MVVGTRVGMGSLGDAQHSQSGLAQPKQQQCCALWRGVAWGGVDAKREHPANARMIGASASGECTDNWNKVIRV